MAGSTGTGKQSRTERYPINGNLVVGGHRTSVRLEAEMWAALKEVAKLEDCTVNDLACRIDRRKKTGQSFTSAIRVFLMLYYRNAAK
jgi:predicted DNA-binding ribbon-helix-helix protein